MIYRLKNYIITNRNRYLYEYMKNIHIDNVIQGFAK